ncbi:hypothetical protein, partial [Mesorhizobium sp. M7D.F.Ca.US.004.01.2.1]
SLNPSLGVVIVNGYTDLVTPYLASRYLVNQIPVARQCQAYPSRCRRGRAHDVFQIRWSARPERGRFGALPGDAISVATMRLAMEPCPNTSMGLA